MMGYPPGANSGNLEAVRHYLRPQGMICRIA
jgi:hypothetical protein